MKPLLLPDFCAPRAVLMVLVIVTLTALLLTLAVPGPGALFWGELARRLMFLIWVGLTGAAVLCGLRTRIAAFGALAGGLLVLGVLLVVVAGISEAAWWILNGKLFNASALLGSAPVEHELFLARNLAIGLIVGALALRYAYVAQQWRLNVEAQAFESIGAQTVIQLKGVLFSLVWSGVVTAIIFYLIKLTIGLRPTEEVEREGLDIAEHGERAYD